MKKFANLILAAGVFAFAAQTPAELPVGSHYPLGAEGIKGADLPPPGFYVRDYNYFYTADKVDGLPANIDLFAYVQAPKLVWMSPWTILGANYGMDTIVPFADTHVSAPFGNGSQFNLADIYFSPLVLAWHFKQFDIGAAYGIWAPSGNFDTSSPLKQMTSPGRGYWSHMLTLGGVWYPDEEKTWAVSLLNRYEISTEQDDTHITPGNMLSMEWGVSKNIGHETDLGLIGYYQQQITEDSASSDATAATSLSNVFGVGPEINTVWTKIGLITSLRYIYEIEARDRPQGHTITLTLTKRF